MNKTIWLFGSLAVLAANAALAAPGTTTRVSVRLVQAQGSTFQPSLNADGRYVAFASTVAMVDWDTNGFADIFVHDRQTGVTTLESVPTNGGLGNGGSANPKISADGRFVAFMSQASNLVAGDTNGRDDIFVHDRQTGATTMVSGGSSSSGYPSISGDGRYVAFETAASDLVPGDTNNRTDVFVRDRQTGGVARMSVASNGQQTTQASIHSTISADGRYVAFASTDSNLVVGDTNGTYDVFVHDRVTGATTRVSVGLGGVESNGQSAGPSLSADGRYVAFQAGATNLVAGDTNAKPDVFVYDRAIGVTTRVSVASDGTQANNTSMPTSISGDGRYVAFFSTATNLVVGDTNAAEDVFVHDRITGVTTRASVASDGTQANGPSMYDVAINADGRYVAFMSTASNLVPDDTNAEADVFVHELVPPATFTLKESLVTGCKSVIGTITLSEPAPNEGVIFTLSDTLSSAIPPATVTIAAGYTTKTFSIKTSPVATLESGIVKVTSAIATVSQDLVVRPMGLTSITLTPTSVVGSQPSTGKATLECKAGPGPVTVDLATTNGAVAYPVAANIVVPQETQSATFNVVTNPVLTKTTATISGTANGITKSKVLTVTPAAVVSPASLKFGSVAVGTTSGPLSVTLTNKGAVGFSVNSIAVTGTFANWFAQTNNCPASLAAGASCTISATFTPQAVASKSAKLSIATSATSTPLSVSLSGAGI